MQACPESRCKNTTCRSRAGRPQAHWAPGSQASLDRPARPASRGATGSSGPASRRHVTALTMYLCVVNSVSSCYRCYRPHKPSPSLSLPSPSLHSPPSPTTTASPNVDPSSSSALQSLVDQFVTVDGVLYDSSYMKCLWEELMFTLCCCFLNSVLDPSPKPITPFTYSRFLSFPQECCSTTSH